MARRRGRDRVVGRPATGGSQFNEPSGTLPRSTYRDVEALSGTLRRDQSVYRSVADPFGPARHSFIAYKVGALRGYRRLPKTTWKARPILPSMRFVLGDIPSRVKFCVRRKARREVLFAFRRAGFRGSAPKKRYRRNGFSNYGC